MIRLTRKDNSQLIAQLSWVAKARGGTYPITQNLHIAHGTATATDGHRLHRVSSGFLEGYDEGLYEVIKATQTELIINKSSTGLNEYPDFRRIMPTEPEKRKLPSDLDSQVAAILQATPETWCYNVNYLLDALGGADCHFPYFSSGAVHAHHPLVLHGADYYTLVMPKRAF